MKLDKRLKEYIEMELMDYQSNMEKVKMIEELIFNPTKEETYGIRSEGKISQPAESTALKLATDKVLLKAKMTIHCINTALQKLDEEHRKIFDYRYKKYYSPIKIATELHMDKVTVHRKVNNIIMMTAIEMGFDVEKEIA